MTEIKVEEPKMQVWQDGYGVTGHCIYTGNGRDTDDQNDPDENNENDEKDQDQELDNQYDYWDCWCRGRNGGEIPTKLHQFIKYCAKKYVFARSGLADEKERAEILDFFNEERFNVIICASNCCMGALPMIHFAKFNEEQLAFVQENLSVIEFEADQSFHMFVVDRNDQKDQNDQKDGKDQIGDSKITCYGDKNFHRKIKGFVVQ